MNQDNDINEVIYIDNNKSLDEQKRDLLNYANKYYKDLLYKLDIPFFEQQNSNIFHYRLTMNNIGAFDA